MTAQLIGATCDITPSQERAINALIQALEQALLENAEPINPN